MAKRKRKAPSASFHSRATVRWNRSPTSAARHAALVWGQIAGEPPNAIWLAPKGTRRVQLVRHLVVHTMRELGYRQKDIAGALGRHHSTVAHSHLAVWRMREDFRVDQLVERMKAIWIDSAADHAREFTRRAKAFAKAWDKVVAERRADGFSLIDEDLARPLAAAADAVVITHRQQAEDPARPAVPIVEAHPAETILSHAPAIRRLVGRPTFTNESTRTGGVRLSLIAQTQKASMQKVLDAAGQILERSGFSALSEGLFQSPSEEGTLWRAVLRVAPAPMLALAAALGLIAGGDGGQRGPGGLMVAVELEAA